MKNNADFQGKGDNDMQNREISRATLGRIPVYLQYLKALPPQTHNISATTIAKELGLGEVQVRKDLGSISGAGKPKVGYNAAELTESLEAYLSCENGGAVIIGAGKLGRALLDYSGFTGYGLEILAAFDRAVTEEEQSDTGKRILPMEALEPFCKEKSVQIGIITVPAEEAQGVCSRLIQNSIRAIWNFAPCTLDVPPDIAVQYENMALALAHLKIQINK